MKYINTRFSGDKKNISQAILQGLAERGGLYVPEYFPMIKPEELLGYNYQEIALKVFSEFFDGENFQLNECIKAAYDSKFDDDRIVPLVQKGDIFFLELFHGKTLAFKDIALSILPYFIKESMRLAGNTDEMVILVATSGDTGKAALAGFSGVEHTNVVVFYPEDGVSDIQKLQMITQAGSNVCVIGVKGNFDDAQTGVKKIFSDGVFTERLRANNFMLSSANSINIGRLLPQITYYYAAYIALVTEGQISNGALVDVTVPTGNFGNLLAAYYAKKMGLPIRRLICASNENNVLHDFFSSGTYSVDGRSFYQTTSPSMDILISSNLERLIFELVNRDARQVVNLYQNLVESGSFSLPADSLVILKREFFSGWATEEEVTAVIAEYNGKHKYLIDTHTAVAVKVARDFKDAAVPMLIASTASPFKFPHAVGNAIGLITDNKAGLVIDCEIAQHLQISLPQAIQELADAPIIHDLLCDIDEMASFTEKFLGI
jgi:threonine synthase